MFIQSVIFVVLFGCQVSAEDPDPCSIGNHEELGDLLKRSPSFVIDDAPLCDRYLKLGWYSARNYLMSTSSPALGKCGTLYPFWMNGSLPVAVGDSISVSICGVGFSGSCTTSFATTVKKCSTFMVYQLFPLNSCNSAYCFEKMEDENCVAEVPTNVGVIYHGVSYTEDTNTPITEGSIQWNPTVQLRCMFDPLPDSSLYYHVQWYVDNTKISNDQVLNSSSVNKALFTTEDLWNAGKKIGCSIHCIVGAKKSPDSYPCNSTSSPTFFAGIEVLTMKIDVERKGEATVRLRPTIPYASSTLKATLSKQITVIDATDLNIGLHFSESDVAACAMNSATNKCEIKIKSFTYDERHKYDNKSEWCKEETMTIYNKDNLGYDIDNSIRLQLKTRGGDTEKKAVTSVSVYEDVLLPNIMINIVEDKVDWKGKVCQSLADPHMKTFDK